MQCINQNKSKKHINYMFFKDFANNIYPRLILIFFLSITFLQAYAQKPSIENIDRRIGNFQVDFWGNF